MKITTHIIALIVLAFAVLAFSACSTSGVQDARASGVEHRQAGFRALPGQWYARSHRQCLEFVDKEPLSYRVDLASNAANKRIEGC
jgi:hypothetical protein